MCPHQVLTPQPWHIKTNQLSYPASAVSSFSICRVYLSIYHLSILILEGEEGGVEREKNINWIASSTISSRDKTHNLVMCPHHNQIRNLSVHRVMLTQQSHTNQGHLHFWRIPLFHLEFWVDSSFLGRI